ncbi:hypothetical protein KIN20_028356, partial [Parelaphostrongylus tenuis]
EYDCQAEQLALFHAASCDRRELSPFARPGYSENIHILDTTATDLLGAIQNVSYKSQIYYNLVDGLCSNYQGNHMD